MASHGDSADPPPSGEPEGEKKAAVSFGFSKTVSKFKPSTDPGIGKDEPDYLTGIDGKELLSTKPVDKPKELIIPLIQRNRWCDKTTGADPSEAKPPAAPQGDDSVEAQAVKELIEDSQRQQEKWQNGPQPDLNLSIPLLMQNQVPQGFEDGDKIKVDLRPESSTDADYDSVPVEAYGLAMLKGMGWNQDEGIGRTFKQNVKPIEHQLRPKGLGLGADRSAVRDLEPKGRRRPPKPGDEPGKEEEDLVLGPGGCVLVESGAHKELYGKIEGVDPDNARVVVKLAIGGQTVTISQYGIKLVDRKEYERNSKDLTRLSRAHKEKEKEKEREKEKEKERHRKEDEKRSNGDERTKHKSSERDRDRGKDERKRKHRDSSPHREKPAVKEPRKLPAVPCWLQRDLKVRFIDKAFKGGRYYNSKMRVEDVQTPTTCICRTDEGRLLDDVKQSMLETIVPKNDSEAIMVVLGKHRGQVGRILQRDRDGCKALVQLDRYEEEVFSLDYDTICHYLGAVDH
ncbi:G-patch domain and KOW motifs-containing protein [Merluccius polli]|uniref:G-patch domain and KOW motifs-containing protein n=1 Tax=Merluccius polli TaxID=89951 RepID=A0AA47MDP0_MERPO|nr:G-patch domain and KOW motifs-containing protein [Merluccius polli]KAK0138327.1 G-patch domain and KOW motifs-containing protein [Merluccius polli]